jgi:hypothetical protein
MMGLGNDFQLKTAVAISSYLDQRIAEVVFERLWALTVAGIAGGIHHGIILGMPQCSGIPVCKTQFVQGFGLLLQQAVFADQVLGFLIAGQ